MQQYYHNVYVKAHSSDFSRMDSLTHCGKETFVCK